MTEWLICCAHGEKEWAKARAFDYEHEAGHEEEKIIGISESPLVTPGTLIMINEEMARFTLTPLGAIEIRDRARRSVLDGLRVPVVSDPKDAWRIGGIT